jgi:hypothetical protein
VLLAGRYSNPDGSGCSSTSAIASGVPSELGRHSAQLLVLPMGLEPILGRV